MLCPSCREVLPEGAKFCEACGADVSDVVGVDPETGAPAPPSAHSSSGCVSCGADGALIDADGYCGQCGFRQPRGRDHLEAELAGLAGVTDRGMRHHRNEDAMAMALVDGVADGTSDGVIDAMVAIVCDGVSTTQDPDVASQAAADAACAFLADVVRTRPIALPGAIEEAAAAAQAAVLTVPFDPASAPSGYGPPSCTLVCVVRVGARAFVGNIGDSRAYWLDPSGVTPLTVDDSWAAEVVAAGLMDVDAAMADPRAHTITRWLGADAPPPEARPKVFVIPGPGRLLLCSDGLWNYAEHASELAAKIGEQPADVDALTLARALTDFAKQAGGHDNITVVVADVTASSLPAGEPTPPTTSPTSPPTRVPTDPAIGAHVTTFSAEVFQNEYLPEGGTTVDAVVTVTADGVVAAPTEAVEVIILDRSGSMNEEGGAKIRAAREATASAIEQLRDGVWFAVVGGNNVAEVLYPWDGSGLAVASANTKAQAIEVVRRIEAHEGTAIGSWLMLAAQLFALRPTAIHHAILLTDGKNQHETAQQLDGAIARCVGQFECDCRGLGADWNVEELRKIAVALLGSVDIIPRPADMDAAFRELMEAAMGKAVADVRLRMWAPQGSRVEFVRQVAPAIDDMTPRAAPVNALTADFPLGAWATAEARDYHLRVTIPPGSVGDERLAARVMLMVGDQQVSAGLVKAIWTSDEQLSTRIDRQVAHYTGQAELAEAIADGLAAREAGDEATATVRLGRAVQLAHEGGNTDTVRLLKEVVDVDNPETGTVRLKRDVDKLTAMTLDTRSTRTVRVNKSS